MDTAKSLSLATPHIAGSAEDQTYSVTPAFSEVVNKSRKSRVRTRTAQADQSCAFYRHGNDGRLLQPFYLEKFSPGTNFS